MKEQLLETVERSLMEKVDKLMTKTCQMNEEINELKDTTEDIKNEIANKDEKSTNRNEE